MREAFGSARHVVNLSDLEGLAEEVLTPIAWAYCSGGAGDEQTLAENEAAWARRRLRPRVMVDVSTIDVGAALLGRSSTMPVGIAPTALHGLCHPDAELAMATAAAALGIPYVFSSLATRPMEDVAQLRGPRWFQLYNHPLRSITVDLVRRAERCGFGAIVLTADLPVMGRREREIRSGYSWGAPRAYGCFETYVARHGDAVGDGLHHFQLTWDDLAWIREVTDLPLVLKGVTTGEDAALACERGVAAVWISNHGGRQLDRVSATADVLEECVQAVGGRAEVYVDGGIRRGSDVLTALGLGARAVFIGRSWLYALAAGGEQGVVAAGQLLLEELRTSMALLGAPTPASLTRSHVL